MLRQILVTITCFSLSTFASKSRQNSSNSHDSYVFQLPLRANEGWLLAEVNVGPASNLSLAITTTSRDVVILSTFYEPSNKSHDLDTNGSIQFIEPVDSQDTCTWYSNLDYSLSTDVVSAQGLLLQNETIINETKTETAY